MVERTAIKRPHSHRAAATPGALAFGALLLVLAVQAGCGGAGPNGADTTAQAKSNEAAPIGVTTAPALSRQVPLYVEATGSFVAEESSDVAPLTSGRVAATPVDVGAFVNRGDVIVRLDDSDARLRLQQAQASARQTEAAVRQAEAKIGLNRENSFDATVVPEVQASRAAFESAQAEVRLAEADAKRYENLVKTGDVSQSNFEKALTGAETAKARADAARRQYEAATNAAQQNYQGVESAQASLEVTRAQLAIAEKALADTVIRAPISGYVSARAVSVGEYVTTSSKIATVLRGNPVKLELQVPEGDAGKLREGMPVTARVVAHGDRDFQGKVTALNPAIDPSSRALTVEAKFDNPKLELRPGMFSAARILLPETEEAILVPPAAVLSDPNTDSAQAFVIEDGRARVRVVRVGEREDGMVRLLSGVSEGETIATSNLDLLYEGLAVNKR